VLESSCGQKFAAEGRAHGRRAGRPAAARHGVAGSPGRPVRRRPARRPRTSGRASRRGPPRQPVLRRIMPTSSGFASEAHRRATEDGRAREAYGGGFGSGAARIQHRLLAGRLCRRRPEPSRRSPVGHRGQHFPARGRGGDVALPPSPPPSFGREHGRRVSRRASPVPPGLGRFAAAGGRRATPGRCRTPATPPGRRRPSPGRSSEPRSPSCHQVWEPLPRNGDV
jgi:hypothetical protein